MAFNLDGFVIDRVQLAWAEDFSGNPLFVLPQVSEPSIEITADSDEARDAQGVLIKKFYRGKTGTFTCQSTFFDFNILSASAGTKKEVASTTNKLTLPKIMFVNKGTKDIVLPNLVEGTLKVNAIANNGTMGKAYTQGAAGADSFGIDGDKLTLPTDETNTGRYIVKYDRQVTGGTLIRNKANVYPQTMRLYLKCLGIDPCKPDELRGLYIYLPSFQPSPETTIQMQTDSTLEFQGDLQVDYCSSDKELYQVFTAEEDINEVE